MSASGSLRIRLALPRADFELAVDLHLPGSGITVLFGACLLYTSPSPRDS